MFRTLKKLYVAIVILITALLAVLAAIVGIFLWKKYKIAKAESANEKSTDIFEEEDFDLDDTV